MKVYTTILVVAKIWYGNRINLWGIDLKNHRQGELVDFWTLNNMDTKAFNSKYGKYEVGEVWKVTYEVEYNSGKFPIKEGDYLEDISGEFSLEKEIKLCNLPYLESNLRNLYERKLQVTDGGNLFVWDGVNVGDYPNLYYWKCDQDLRMYKDKYGRARYQYDDKKRRRIYQIVYSGVAPAIDIIPKGTIICMKLASAWAQEDSEETKKRFLQIASFNIDNKIER